MKLACASSACSRAFDRGDLTQLEFLDLAAREIDCDGVVLDVRHFPRTDDDYLAQVKKMATDLGLVVAALAGSGFFSSTPEEMRRTLAAAAAVGAPLVSAPLAAETSLSWSAQLERIGAATGLAKAANVTLAVRNAPATFAASAHDCKRVAKEADSAWLRFGLQPDAFDAASDPQALAAQTVLLWAADGGEPPFAPWEAFRGFVVLDRPDGSASIPEMQSAMRRWHIARAKLELNRT